MVLTCRYIATLKHFPPVMILRDRPPEIRFFPEA